MNVRYHEEAATNTTGDPSTTLERWLEVKPYHPATLGRYCNVPLNTMLRIIRGQSPIDHRAGLLLAGLLGVPFELLFEDRAYRNGRRALRGWFARALTEREGVA